ncbi:PEBP-like protein [Coprinellus micaceus]|uniref:PEBP-like protein n=1 Tax=Coprinellus micaceus TaxID=71717 RepID=A0A4Y7SL16_COPMI|nr:PEBP-like protein [Coprinellus micaceus]TEB26679.1 PEBP-like protein [Coprinellus micaceus]
MSSDLIASILSSLKESGVIPDVIPESLDFTPSEFFTVAYPSKTLTEVGGKFTKDEAQQEPELYLIDNDEGEAAAEETYTLVMTDPDAPSRADPKYGQWRHWVIPGLKVQNGAKGVTALQKTRTSLTPYFGPSPPPGSGPHRYVFLLFEDPTPDYSVAAEAVEHNGEFTSRRNWNALKFADEYVLKLVGVNYFFCEVSA